MYLRKELEYRNIKYDIENFSYLVTENIRKSFEDVLEIDRRARLIVDQYYVPMVYSATTCQ